MQFDDLARHYASLTDGELLHLEKSSGDLLPEAASLLRQEIHRRRIPPEEPESPPSRFSQANSFSQTAADPFLPDAIDPSYVASPESIDQLSRTYQTKTDDEIFQLAGYAQNLTLEAHRALRDELVRRGIERPLAARIIDERSEPVLPREIAAQGYRASPSVADFIAEVMRLYRSRFWTFFKLTAPASAIGYLAYLLSHYEIREIQRRLLSGVGANNDSLAIFEGAVLALVRYLVTWLAFSFAFAVICSAVRRPSQSSNLAQPYAQLRARLGKFLVLSLLLFCIAIALAGLANLADAGIWSFITWQRVPVNGWGIWMARYALYLATLSVLSRFALAIPAFLWEGRSVTQSLFRSDELTEGQWLNLAALLAKMAVAGYVAGMLPYWIAGWLLKGAMVPWWFDDAQRFASFAAVSAVEPMLFIGFAVLYEHRSAVSLPATEAVPALSAS